jgi:hypothetical protein
MGRHMHLDATQQAELLRIAHGEPYAWTQPTGTSIEERSFNRNGQTVRATALDANTASLRQDGALSIDAAARQPPLQRATSPISNTRATSASSGCPKRFKPAGATAGSCHHWCHHCAGLMGRHIATTYGAETTHLHSHTGNQPATKRSIC